MMHSKAAELHPISVHGAHHQVGLDVLGPLPLSVSGKLCIVPRLSTENVTNNAEANFKALPGGGAGWS